LISSLPIKRELLEKANNNTLSLDLIDSHIGLETINIIYRDIVLTKAGLFDFWQTFWFEIERRGNLSPAQLESAK
jgi:hypothetical protein